MRQLVNGLSPRVPAPVLAAANGLRYRDFLTVVLMLRDRLGVSERRACRIVGQHRSTQRHEPVVTGDDRAIR